MSRTPFSPPQVGTPASNVPFPRPSSDHSVEFVPLLLGGAPANDALHLDAEQIRRNEIFEEALREGHAEGSRLGRAEAEAELGQLVASWRCTLEELVSLRAQVLEAYRRELLELALGAAEAWVQADLGAHAGHLEQILDQALGVLGREEALRVTVCATDAVALREWIGSRPELGAAITVESSSKLRSGDLRVTSASGSVESLLQERIARVRALVLGELAEEEESS